MQFFCNFFFKNYKNKKNFGHDARIYIIIRYDFNVNDVIRGFIDANILKNN